MPDLGKLSRRSALGLIAGGSIVMASETFGFTEVTAGRMVGIETVADSDAFLGIEGIEAENTPTFTNNGTDVDMVVELSSDDGIEFDLDGDEEYDETVTFSLVPDERQEIDIRGEDDEADVVIDVDLFEDDERTGSIELERTFDIPQASAIEDVEGTVRRVGGSGKYEFSLENKQPEGGQTVEIDGIRIDAVDEDSDADQVGGEDDDDILVLDPEGDEEQIVDELIHIGGDFVDFARDATADVVELEPNGEEEGAEKEFEFDRFRPEDEQGNPNAPTDDVDLTVRAIDGSTAQIELRSD